MQRPDLSQILDREIATMSWLKLTHSSRSGRPDNGHYDGCLDGGRDGGHDSEYDLDIIDDEHMQARWLK